MNRGIAIRGIPVVAADVFLFASLLFYTANRDILLLSTGVVGAALLLFFITARQVDSNSKANY